MRGLERGADGGGCVRVSQAFLLCIIGPTVLELDMGWQAYLVVCLVMFGVGLMIKGQPPDFVLFGIVTITTVTQCNTFERAVEGFGNHGVVSVGILFVVAKGISSTGSLEYFLRRLLGTPRTVAMAQLRVLIPVACLSGFLSNTPVVAMMIPISLSWGSRIGVHPQKLLMPVSYTSMLAGMCTSIGSSSNLIVLEKGEDLADPVRFSFFEVGAVGLPLLGAGILYMMFMTRIIFPNKLAKASETEMKRTGSLKVRMYPITFVVEPSADVLGYRVFDSGLMRLEGAKICRIVRGETIFDAEPDRERDLDENKPDDNKDEDGTPLLSRLEQVVFQAHDRVEFLATPVAVRQLRKHRGLVPDVPQLEKLGRRRRRRCLVECAVGTKSSLVGKTLRELRFRQRFSATVLAIRQKGTPVNEIEAVAADGLSTVDLADVPLEPSDGLLMETYPRFVPENGASDDFALAAVIEGSQPPRHSEPMDRFRLYISIVLLLVMVGMTASKFSKLYTSASVVALMLVLTRCMTLEEAWKSIKGSTLMTIAAAFGVSNALHDTGAAHVIATLIVEAAAPIGEIGLQVALFIVVNGMASIISVNATVLLMYPIVQEAVLGHYEMKKFLVILMVGASSSFCTPISYQTNIMVQEPGRYLFSDYFKLGAPLQVICLVLCIAMVNIVY